MGGISLVQLLIFIPLCISLILLFLLPSILAIHKNHRYKIPIVLINLIGGLLFGTGWLIALIWCFIQTPSNTVSSANEIEKLYELKEKNIISPDEFEKKKRELLS